MELVKHLNVSVAENYPEMLALSVVLVDKLLAKSE